MPREDLLIRAENRRSRLWYVYKGDRVLETFPTLKEAQAAYPDATVVSGKHTEPDTE